MKFILNLVSFSAKLCQNTLSDLEIEGGFTQFILHSHISFSTLLPCRISVYEDGDVTKIATVMPTKLQCIVGKNKTLNDIAKDVEKIIVKIIDEAK